MKKGVGLTHGKTILLGEHAVVYKNPAIAFPIKSLQLKAVARHSKTASFLETPFYSGVLSNHSAEELPIERLISETALRTVLQFLGEQQTTVHVSVTGYIPPARGLGSSAAVAGTISRAVAGLFGVVLSANDLFELVQSVERVAHGTPSGLDAHATSSDQPIWFENGVAHPLECPIKPHLLVADTGLEGRTSLAVSKVRERYQRDPLSTKQLFAEVSELVFAAGKNLRDSDFVSLGSKMHRNHQILRELGVSDPSLDHLVETANSCGALGAKLTGGGLGGCAVVLAEDASHLLEIKKVLLENGAKAVWHVTDSNEIT